MKAEETHHTEGGGREVKRSQAQEVGKCEAEEGEGKREIKRKTGNEREGEDMRSQGCSFHDSLAKLLIFIQRPVLILLLLFAVRWILNRMYARFHMKESQVPVLFCSVHGITSVLGSPALV